MKNSMMLFGISSFLVGVFSCGTNEIKHTENTVSNLDFQIIQTGVLHGAGEEGFSQSAIEVTNFENYNLIKDEINSVNEELEGDIIKEPSFFDDQMLVFIFDKVRGTGGYSFNAKHALIQNDTVSVTVFSKKPKESAPSVITQPFQILKMERLNKEIKLVIIE